MSRDSQRSNLTRHRFQLDLAEDIGLVSALRKAEESFSSGVLPRDPELMARGERIGFVARSKADDRGQMAIPFPSLAA